ncbi:hypothetical protein AAG906_023854 [Vitis piasezkii]
MCVYHKDHDHTTEQCKSLHYLVERLIKVGHLKQYVRATGGQSEAARDLAAQVPTSLAAPRAIINYIHGGPVDKKYNSKRKRQRFLRADSIRERVSSIQHNFLERSIRPVDGIVTFPPVNACRVLQPHEDTLILTLGISGFDIRRVLVDLVIPSTYHQMVSYLTKEGQIDLLGSQLAVHQCYQVHASAKQRHLLLDSLRYARNPSVCGLSQAQCHTLLTQKIIQTEIDKLLAAGFIKEVKYPDWLANIVNTTARHGMLSFIDVFSGYHQIPMFQLDENKTTFVTPHGLYCYKVMSFGPKNVGTTYKKLMTKIFKPLIGRTMEHVQHLEETFHLMRAYNMKLNPAKCAFGVSAGKFLGFMVT